jgi:hypothetical protein
MTNAILKTVEDNFLKNKINSDIESISGTRLLNEYYLKLQESYTDTPENLMRFYCIGFLISYENQGKLKHTLFKSNYFLLENCSSDIRNILYDNLIVGNIKFLKYCFKMEPVPFFLHDQPEIPKLINDLVFKSFRQQMPVHLSNYLDIIKFISLYNLDTKIDVDYINKKLSKRFLFKYWQATQNPHTKLEGLVYSLEINDKKVTTCLRNAIVWQWMEDGATILLKKNNTIAITGYDNNKYLSLDEFISKFKHNEFVNEHLPQYFASKIQKARTNKEEWRACKLNLELPTKVGKEKLGKI